MTAVLLAARSDYVALVADRSRILPGIRNSDGLPSLTDITEGAPAPTVNPNVRTITGRKRRCGCHQQHPTGAAAEKQMRRPIQTG